MSVFAKNIISLHTVERKRLAYGKTEEKLVQTDDTSVPRVLLAGRNENIKSVNFTSLHIEIWKILNCGKRSGVDARVYDVGFTFIIATRVFQNLDMR